MRLSYLIITRNRRERLLDTLERLERDTPAAAGPVECLVVDNASTDGTAEAVASRFPTVRLLALAENRGMPARNVGIEAARGRYLVLLDDDSYPLGDTVVRSMAYLDRTPATAAVCGRVELPDGTLEASALPGVMIGCGTCLRRSVLDEVGGFPEDFFRQAEEYDLSFRLAGAGYRVERFEDLAYRHDKSPHGRSSELTVRMDLLNNLTLCDRYLPAGLREAYRHDWQHRYTALGRAAGLDHVIGPALDEARAASRAFPDEARRTLGPSAVERLLHLEATRDAIGRWAGVHGLHRVVLGALGKNIFAAYRACREVGLDVLAVQDESPAFIGERYRELPVLSLEEVVELRPDGLVLTDVNPARVRAKAETLRRRSAWPVLTLWRPASLHAVEETRGRAA